MPLGQDTTTPTDEGDAAQRELKSSDGAAPPTKELALRTGRSLIRGRIAPLRGRK